MRQSQTTVAIWNMALARLGGEQLPSVEAPWENDTLGVLCKNNYPAVLDEALASYDWSFATRREYLAEKTDALPHSVYRFRYGLPADCLRPIAVDGGYGPICHYEIEGIDLLTNAAPALLRYVARVEDARLYPPAFAEALAWGLAGIVATANNDDPQTSQRCYQAYQVALAEAQARDRNSQRPRPKPSAWLLARGGSYGRWHR